MNMSTITVVKSVNVCLPNNKKKKLALDSFVIPCLYFLLFGKKIHFLCEFKSYKPLKIQNSFSVEYKLHAIQYVGLLMVSVYN